MNHLCSKVSVGKVCCYLAYLLFVILGSRVAVRVCLAELRVGFRHNL